MTDIPHDHLGHPDLQALVRQCGGFDKISLELWTAWDRANARIVLGICTDGGPPSQRIILGETGLLIVVLALVKPLSPSGDFPGQLICGPIEA